MAGTILTLTNPGRLLIRDSLWLYRQRFVLGNGAPRRALEIVVLPAFERPEKCEQADEPKPQRQRHKNHEDFHHALPRATRRARSAFNITRTYEPDIAAAAIRGVTKPAIA